MRKVPNSISHLWPDAWLLVSIKLASHEAAASLAAIIGAADAIQHAIPEFAEMDGALARLVAAGLVSRGSGTFELTPDGAELVPSKAVSWIKQQEIVAQALGVTPWTPEYRPAISTRGALPGQITQMEFDEAVKHLK